VTIRSRVGPEFATTRRPTHQARSPPRRGRNPRRQKAKPGPVQVITLTRPRAALAPGRVPVCPGLFLFLTNALLAFPELTGPGTLRLSGPLYRKEVPLGPGLAIGSGGRGKARRGTPWRGVAGGVSAWYVWLGLVTPKRIRTSPASLWIAVGGHIFAHQSRKRAVTI
jgi:hypothetical protein